MKKISLLLVVLLVLSLMATACSSPDAAVEEQKVIKFGVFDKLNAPMTKFTLINNHGMFDRVEQKTEISGELSQSIKPDLSGGKTDTLKKLKEELEASK
jgi:PBP1b-binding outer membrane lipoprotein LpoB